MLPAEKLEPWAPDAERRFLLVGVPWELYMALRDALEGAGTRMTYLEGNLELMSPSETHEEERILIARLLDVWADASDVDLRRFGSTTYRRQDARRGLEPDDCFTVGAKERDVPPQIAIEVIVSNPLIDKLDVYAGLGIQEVWVWQSEARRLGVHRLAGRRYVEQERSSILPSLDLELLASFIRPGESQVALTRAYRAALGRSG